VPIKHIWGQLIQHLRYPRRMYMAKPTSYIWRLYVWLQELTSTSRILLSLTRLDPLWFVWFAIELWMAFKIWCILVWWAYVDGKCFISFHACRTCGFVALCSCLVCPCEVESCRKTHKSCCYAAKSTQIAAGPGGSKASTINCFNLCSPSFSFVVVLLVRYLFLVTYLAERSGGISCLLSCKVHRIWKWQAWKSTRSFPDAIGTEIRRWLFRRRSSCYPHSSATARIGTKST
jgi:hypothetical protein